MYLFYYYFFHSYSLILFANVTAQVKGVPSGPRFCQVFLIQFYWDIPNGSPINAGDGFCFNGKREQLPAFISDPNRIKSVPFGMSH